MRDQAFKTIDLFLKRLESHAAAMVSTAHTIIDFTSEMFPMLAGNSYDRGKRCFLRKFTSFKQLDEYCCGSCRRASRLGDNFFGEKGEILR